MNVHSFCMAGLRQVGSAWAGAVMAVLIATLMAPSGVHAAEVRVAVAANFAGALKRISQDFERDTGHRVSAAVGSTGQLEAQIRQGAPFAVFLAADDQAPARLERAGLAVAGTRLTYAVGRLVLWSAEPGRVDDRGEVLRTGAFDRIAVANPKLAPYGAAALQTLDRMGLRERLGPKIVEGANITQTHQFVASRNAPLGFVALSQVMQHGVMEGGSAWIVPASLHSPLTQEAVLLTAGRHNPAASALLAYLQTERTKGIIRSLGYEVP